MLDLNLSVISGGGDDPVEMAGENLLDFSAYNNNNNNPMESSGSFDSSIVNAETITTGAGASAADDDSSSIAVTADAFAFSFGILKTGQQEVEAENNRTIPLFPVNVEGDGGKSTGSSEKEWLDLGVSMEASEHHRGGGAAEQMIVAHQQLQQQVQLRQQVKKSRRGPRSRSSQYRGVTFYRRTGRWESHIWLVFFTYSFLSVA